MNPTRRLRDAAHGGRAGLGPTAEDSSLGRPAPTAAVQRPSDGVLQSLDRATGWLNTGPLTAAGLLGKAVLVNFWTYTCINWLRTLPHLRAWSKKYSDHGLVVIGVHTPEFDFESDLENVRQAVKAMGIDYPVAVDNDYGIWTSFDNHFWPALYFLDVHGRIHQHHFGEGNYEQSEMIIQRLASKTGASGVGRDLVQIHAAGVEVAADWDNLWSPENYLGSDRTENFASPNGAVHGARHTYSVPPRLRLNHWALSGDWTITREAVVLNQAGGLIANRFRARDLHLVMAPTRPGSRIRFRVRLDGHPPVEAQGIDVDVHGEGTLIEPRLYQLIRQPGPVGERSFEITFLDPGVRAYAFTFG
jgi:thiol-disulfide isomerase/thioredoxin